MAISRKNRKNGGSVKESNPKDVETDDLKEIKSEDLDMEREKEDKKITDDTETQGDVETEDEEESEDSKEKKDATSSILDNFNIFGTKPVKTGNEKIDDFVETIKELNVTETIKEIKKLRDKVEEDKEKSSANDTIIEQKDKLIEEKDSELSELRKNNEDKDIRIQELEMQIEDLKDKSHSDSKDSEETVEQTESIVEPIDESKENDSVSAEQTVSSNESVDNLLNTPESSSPSKTTDDSEKIKNDILGGKSRKYKKKSSGRTLRKRRARKSRK